MPVQLGSAARVLIAAVLLSAVAAPQEPLCPNLTNEDVLAMHRAGLSDEVVSEKIKSSVCNFDTSTNTLTQLKSAGVTDAILLAMLHCTSHPASQPVSRAASESIADPGLLTVDAKPYGYTVSYVRADRKWKLGFRSEPYDKISDYVQSNLVQVLKNRGLHLVAALDGTCCQVAIELLEVTTHPAVMKKPGIDVTANLSVTDSRNRLLYAKGYRGESRTVMNTWGHLINHAVEDMVKNMAADENLVKTLAVSHELMSQAR